MNLRPLLTAAVFSLTSWFSATAMGAVVQVAPGHSIQQAIDAARPGDQILIAPGHYREHLRITKPLTLHGQNRPVIDGEWSGDVIRVTATDVTIEGLIVSNSGSDLTAQNAGIYLQPGAHRAIVRHCQLSYNLFGLWIERANNVVIDHNLIVGKRDIASPERGNGIQLYNTTGATITANTISYTRDGIYVDVSHHAMFKGNVIHNVRYGTHYMNSYFNTWDGNEVFHNRGGLALMETRNQVVKNNRVWGNTDHGIMLRTIQDSVIENNVVAGNQRGLFVYDAEYNTLAGNLIVGNHVGVHLWGGSIHNNVSNNDFIQNRQQIRYVAARDVLWPGNYWSNYFGWDRKGHGTGDVPYKSSDIVDRLTWRYPMVKILMSSPALQSLSLISQQFPLLNVPGVVDQAPKMKPVHPDWKAWSPTHD
ncbi:nitrous oxide reductase family maturation protein NosD [Paludibacterium purpuratum]|nr:nitrous oxide reductase family maturation protein NosD [Paludibacterium purpuratum]